MNVVDVIFFMGILIAVVLAIYGYFLVEISEKLYDVHRNSIIIEHLQNDMQCVMNRCKDLSRTVEDLDKKRR